MTGVWSHQKNHCHLLCTLQEEIAALRKAQAKKAARPSTDPFKNFLQGWLRLCNRNACVRVSISVILTYMNHSLQVPSRCTEMDTVPSRRSRKGLKRSQADNWIGLMCFIVAVATSSIMRCFFSCVSHSKGPKYMICNLNQNPKSRPVANRFLPTLLKAGVHDLQLEPEPKIFTRS